MKTSKQARQAALLARLRDKGLGLAPIVSKPSNKNHPARAVAAAPVADQGEFGATTRPEPVRPAERLTGPGPFEIFIVAPCAFMSLNDREHWRSKATKTKAWLRAGRDAAAEQGLPTGLGRVHVSIDVVKATAQSYDVHNLMPTAKAVIDGLVKHGMLADDANEFLTGPDLRPGGKGEPGLRVTVSVLAASS